MNNLSHCQQSDKEEHKTEMQNSLPVRAQVRSLSGVCSTSRQPKNTSKNNEACGDTN